MLQAVSWELLLYVNDTCLFFWGKARGGGGRDSLIKVDTDVRGQPLGFSGIKFFGR